MPVVAFTTSSFNPSPSVLVNVNYPARYTRSLAQKLSEEKVNRLNYLVVPRAFLRETKVSKYDRYVVQRAASRIKSLSHNKIFVESRERTRGREGR